MHQRERAESQCLPTFLRLKLCKSMSAFKQQQQHTHTHTHMLMLLHLVGKNSSFLKARSNGRAPIQGSVQMFVMVKHILMNPEIPLLIDL